MIHHSGSTFSKRSLSSQNLSFGNTNTNNINDTINPYTHAYSIILPHQPFPSVIFLREPIRPCAVSILSSDFSMLAPAALSKFLSSSRVAEKLLELSFSLLARLRIEFEMASCSSRCWSRMASAVAVEVWGLAGLRRLANNAARAVLWDEGVGDGAEGRARNVWVVWVGRISFVLVSAGAVVVEVVGGSGIASAFVGGSGGSGSGILGSSKKSSPGAFDDRLESKLSLGVGMISPRRSSPSDESSSSTATWIPCQFRPNPFCNEH